MLSWASSSKDCPLGGLATGVASCKEGDFCHRRLSAGSRGPGGGRLLPAVANVPGMMGFLLVSLGEAWGPGGMRCSMLDCNAFTSMLNLCYILAGFEAKTWGGRVLSKCCVKAKLQFVSLQV